MASTIITKYGSGAPTASDLVQGELAVDLTNKRIYTEDSSTNILELGTNPTSLTIGGTALTATAAELNTLDGITATTAELNTLDGITATVTELNYTDGVTSNIQTQLDAMVEKAGDSMTGNLSFGDNNKAVFGAGSDLQIYHDGSNSYIQDAGTGQLKLLAQNFQLMNAAGTSDMIVGIDGGTVQVKYNGATKLATTATGIDVTGTVTADGLTVDGTTDLNIGAANIGIDMTSTDEGSYIQVKDNNATGFYFGARAGSFDLYDTDNDAILKANSNGDISFYEDTGTTAKFFWDASTERLGIGTTAPSSDIHVINSSADAILRLAGQTGARIQLGETDVVDKDWHIVANNGNFIINETTDAGGFVGSPLVIEGGAGNGTLYLKSGGNVGIGTTSPATNLHINQSGSVTGDYGVRVGQSSFTGNYGSFTLDTTNIQVKLASSDNYPLGFWVAGSERARIDSSGNLLVGKTSTSYTTAGTIIEPAGRYVASYDGGISGVFARLTSDGDILQFRKDSTTVGSIGTASSNAYFGTADTAIYTNATSDAVQPFNTSTSTVRDGLINLGSSGARFKDLYLSGGVYLGGTGAANKLDDYEEGTWTPVIDRETTSPTITYSSVQGRYTKIGNVVYIDMFLQVGSVTNAGSGFVSITGLPFSSNSKEYPALHWYRADALASNNTLATGSIQYSSQTLATRIRFTELKENGNTTLVSANPSVGYVIASGWYRIA